MPGAKNVFFKDLLNEDAALEHHVARVRQLAAKRDLPYVDAAEVWPQVADLDYFANADHMSTRGHRAYWPPLQQRCFSD